MSMSDMILSRLMTPAWIDFGDRMTSWSTPSMRKRTRSSRSPGSMWMSEARSLIAWVISRLTNLTIGRVVDDLRTAGELLVFLGWRRASGQLVEVVVAAVIAVDRGEQIGLGRDDRLDVAAGQRPDVVDGENVRRVGHRDDAAGRPRTPIGSATCRRATAAVDARRRRCASTGNSLRSTNGSPICCGERRHQLRLGDHAEVDEDPAEAAAESSLLLRPPWSTARD